MRIRISVCAWKIKRRRRLPFLFACALLLPALLGAQPKREPEEKVRAERYAIDVTFQPERGSLSATATVTLRVAPETRAIEFELNPRLEIKEVTDAQGRRLQWDRSRRIASPRLLVRLAEPVPAGAGQETQLTFVYEGRPLLGGLDYITQDGILLRDESRWYPAVDLAAFTQNTIRIAVPSTWQGISSGGSNAIGAGAGATYVWTTQKPVSSRSIVALPFPTRIHCFPAPVEMGGYSKLEPMSACIQQPPGTSKDDAFIRRANVLLKYFSQLLESDWKWSLTAAQGFPGQHGAIGYSAPGFVVVSEDVVQFADDPDFMPEFLPHEIAHQWFPIEVTLARPEDGWLAESLAEYLAWRYLEERQPEAARVVVARAMRDALQPDPLPPLREGLRMFGLYEWDVTYQGLYQRGMLVWRTLETVIGRRRVDAALREYYKRYAGRSASIADFRETCEEISERDLGWFFDYFLAGTHIPEIDLRRVPSSAPGEYAGEIVVKNVPPEFTARVEMTIYTTEGAVEHSVATRGEATPFTVNVPGTVTRVVLDPDARILRWTEAARRNRTQRSLLADLGDLELEGKFAQAIELCGKALEADPENFALNQQQTFLMRGRLHYRADDSEKALADLERALRLPSMDRQVTHFYRAWAHVYRARIFSRQGDATQARAEAQAGLEIRAAALDTEITWPETGKRSTARAELAKFLPTP